MNIFLSSIDIRARQGLRDKALFELFYSSGLRSREASRLLVKDLNPKTAQVYILILEELSRQAGAHHQSCPKGYGSVSSIWNPPR